MRWPHLLLLSSLLVAGCTSSGHDGHGLGLALLFGAKNATNETVELGWTVTAAPNATIVWTKTESLEPAGVVERHEPLETRGEHVIQLSWGASHAASYAWTTEECGGTMHIVVELRSDGSAPETTRECHV